MRLNKKGQESEGPRFISTETAMLIIFIVLLAILMVIILPKIASGEFNATTFNFGSGIFDILTGGKNG